MHNRGLGSWMYKRRLKSPDKTALYFEDSAITYRELADETDRISDLLWTLGVRKGDRVAFLGENSPAFIEVLFGTLQLGAVFVPVNTRLAPPEIAHVLEDSGALILIHDPEFDHRVTDSGREVPHRFVVGGLNRFSLSTSPVTPTPACPSTIQPPSSTPRGQLADPRELC
jgi:fatty-acyl-CoA synthase